MNIDKRMAEIKARVEEYEKYNFEIAMNAGPKGFAVLLGHTMSRFFCLGFIVGTVVSGIVLLLLR